MTPAPSDQKVGGVAEIKAKVVADVSNDPATSLSEQPCALYSAGCVNRLGPVAIGWPP